MVAYDSGYVMRGTGRCAGAGIGNRALVARVGTGMTGHLGPARAGNTFAALWTVLTEDTAELDHRRWAAEALAVLSDTLRRPALAALRAADGDHIVDRARRRLRRSIAELDVG